MPNAHLEEIEGGLLKTNKYKENNTSNDDIGDNAMSTRWWSCPRHSTNEDDHVPETSPDEDVNVTYENTKHLAEACRW